MANTVTAYSVYYYDNAGTGSGMAGRILDNGTTIGAIPNLRTGLNGDPLVEGFTIAAGQRIAVTDRTAGSARPTYVYATSGGVPLATQTWSSVVNPYGLVPIGSYLYALDYDTAQIVEIDAATYLQTGAVFNFNTDSVTGPLVPSGYAAHGQAILNIGGTLYGLFGIANSSFTTYASSVLVKLTISTGSSITVGANDYNSGIEKNAFGMAVSGSDLYIVSIGGAQSNSGYNANSKLQSIPYGGTLNSATVTTVMSPSATYPYEFRDISFNGSTAYILMGAYNASWNMAGKLLSSTNFSSFTTINDFSAGVAGYYWAAQYTPDNNRLWFGRGNQILVYNAASPATPVSTLSVSAGSLITAGQLYTSLNDMSYVSPSGSLLKINGYRSPTQASQTTRAVQARALAQGRPELTDDELDRLQELLAAQD